MLDLERPGVAERMLVVLDRPAPADLPDGVVWLRPPATPPPGQPEATAWLERAAGIIRATRPG